MDAAPDRISLTLRLWRQAGPDQLGGFETHRLEKLSTDLSLLEALDLLNDRLLRAGARPLSFDHDCREGICGSCGFLVNGQAHGPQAATTVCQLYLRQFRDGDTLVLEPWRARALPLLADLTVDRSAFDTATCIGCAACVASCRNASASLFTAAKLAHLALLPQGQPERPQRLTAMLQQMEQEGFGDCSSHLECQAACPQQISADWISWMQRERWRRPGP